MNSWQIICLLCRKEQESQYPRHQYVAERVERALYEAWAEVEGDPMVLRDEVDRMEAISKERREAK